MKDMRVTTKTTLEVCATEAMHEELEYLFYHELDCSMDMVDVEDALDLLADCDDYGDEIHEFLLKIKQHPEYMDVNYIAIV